MRYFAKIHFCFQIYFLSGFTPGKAEQPQHGMELKEQGEEKDVKHLGKMFWWISAKVKTIEKT